MRRHVGRRYQRDTAFEQSVEQRAKNHRIRDVRDEKLVETQHARLARDVIRHVLERRLAVAELFELVVHVVHEAVKVAASFGFERQALEEQVHEPGLAAPDAAPEIQAFLDARRAPSAEFGKQLQRAGGQPARSAAGVRRDQSLAQIVQRIDRCFLRRIRAKAALLQLLAIELLEIG